MFLRISRGPLLQATCKRYLSKNSQRPRPEGKNYRLWMMPGDYVLKKAILAQQYTMKWHPGLNVGIDKDRTLYALCDGVMVITEEKFDPDWRYHLTNEVYNSDGKQEYPDYMRYLSVIPNTRVPEFKLIDLV